MTGDIVQRTEATLDGITPGRVMSDPYYQDDHMALYHGEALQVSRDLGDSSVDCIVTSPPYFGLRDYGVGPTRWETVTYTPIAGAEPIQVPAMSCALGLEPTPAAFVGHLVLILRELRRVLANDGTLWVNLGDSYAAAGKTGSGGLPAKNLLGIPWRTALALQDDGWILRNDIIWSKSNTMPESIIDRLSRRHEHLFMLTKSPKYYFDLNAIRDPHSAASVARAQPHRAGPGRAAREGEPYVGVARPQSMRIEQMNHPDGRNPGDVWTIPTQPFPGAHFATMPVVLAERCIQAGCKPDGTVLDPFSGSGTTGLAASRHGRKYIGVDLNAEYLDLSLRTRLAQNTLDFGSA